MIETRIISVDVLDIDLEVIGQIVDVLRKDKVIVYPTDTFYGLGANYFSVPAKQRVYSLKKRDSVKPLSAVVSDWDMLEGLDVEIPPVCMTLAGEFWPGPLTIVLPVRKTRHRGREDSLAVRVPDHAWLRSLVRKAGFPVTASSANISGEKESADPAEVIDVFKGKVDMIVDGGLTRGGLPSTILDLSRGRPEILREGAVPKEKLIPHLS